MAKQKMIPDSSKAVDMVDERKLSDQEIAAMEEKQQMKMDVEQPKGASLNGRISKVNMNLHSGSVLEKGKPAKLDPADEAHLRKTFSEAGLKKILE